jgi:tRNA nucleotidyltransferase (CCA-adding enzyme)
VRPAPLRDDLARRDFSVNAIALGLDGRIENVPGALDDVVSAQLRVLHSASFRDDPTRLLRLVRYAVRLGFAIEPETARLAREAAAGGALDSLSSDRLAAELVLAAHEPDPVAVVALAADLGVLDGLAPGLVADGPLRGALALLGADGRRDALVLGALARELELAAAVAFVARFAVDARARATAQSVATKAKSLAAALEAAPERPSSWAELLRTSPVETAALAGALGPAERVRRWLEELRHVRLEIDGADLLAAGVAEGPAVGAGLALALALRLDGQLAPGGAAEVEAALAAARRARS